MAKIEEQTNLTDRPADDGCSDHDAGRRESLKRLGGYAASVAPAMLVLMSGRADAHHAPWHRPPGQCENPGGGSLNSPHSPC